MNAHSDDPLHVASCADCQVQSDLGGLDVNLDRVWSKIAAEVRARPAGRLERWLGSALRSPGLARALLTTPSLVLSWVLATAAVLAVGAFFTANTDGPWTALLAPALAGIGIACAYGPGVDPAWELSKTMAVSDRMVLLVRAVAVFGVNAVLALLASLFTDQALILALGWLVPMTSVSALALAVATWSRSAPVGVGGGLAGWAIVVLATSRGLQDLPAAVPIDALPFFGIATVVLAALALYATGSRRMEVPRWQ